jgi:hypothetical protein
VLPLLLRPQMLLHHHSVPFPFQDLALMGFYRDTMMICLRVRRSVEFHHHHHHEEEEEVLAPQLERDTLIIPLEMQIVLGCTFAGPPRAVEVVIIVILLRRRRQVDREKLLWKFMIAMMTKLLK